jgi:hypothetical protein
MKPFPGTEAAINSRTLSKRTKVEMFPVHKIVQGAVAFKKIKTQRMRLTILLGRMSFPITLRLFCAFMLLVIEPVIRLLAAVLPIQSMILAGPGPHSIRVTH